MIPSWDQTGISHFHSSTTSGSACLISARRRASISPRQSASSSILASMSLDAEPLDADLTVADSAFLETVFFMKHLTLHWACVLGPCQVLSLNLFISKRDSCEVASLVQTHLRGNTCCNNYLGARRIFGCVGESNGGSSLIRDWLV